MNIASEPLNNTLTEILDDQLQATALWHVKEPADFMCLGEATFEGLKATVLMQHLCNFRLWHIEDMARKRDVDDTAIANCKRAVDKLNQQRNDLMERVDACLTKLLAPLLPGSDTGRHNTETMGMIVDRLSILSLKIFHMAEQAERKNTSEEHKVACAAKFRILQKQRTDLVVALLELIDDFIAGVKAPVSYYQFKMYNDPSLNPELYSNKN